MGTLLSATLSASNASATDLLIKVEAAKSTGVINQLVRLTGSKNGTAGNNISAITETLHDGTRWVSLKSQNKSAALSMRALTAMPGVLVVQPNYPIRLMNDYRLADGPQREALAHAIATKTIPGVGTLAKADNPAIPAISTPGIGADSLFSSQWGMSDNNVVTGWKGTKGEGFVVAVLDSGVDYTHEDLVDNMWHNPGETGVDSQGRDKATNGVDDDGNGYIDDVVGWDFVSNDNKPFDLSVTPIELLMGGGNPGHGTHCAGNIAARGDNGKGIAGVAPKAQIMALRFLSEKGEGSTEAAVKAIQYSIKMGVKVSSNSWGSSGEDPADAVGNKALRDVLEEARLAGQLFVAAAGNGDAQGKGYDNDTNAAPAYPSSYPDEHILSVAAIDKTDGIGTFSNWGPGSVDIGAPGVAIFSTMVENQYSDKVVSMPEFGIEATWDGTSMATPHVAGAAALYWADHPKATALEVKKAIMESAKPITSLAGKVVTGGKLSVEQLMR
jgi:subtilisin family serine protease